MEDSWGKLEVRIVVLMSGGIDSPVAAHLLSKENEVFLLHMDNRPFTDDREIEKVKLLARNVRSSFGKNIPLYVAPGGYASQTETGGKCLPRYQCVLCRRMMLRFAEAFAKRIGAEAIGTGESLGQVASQTLQNMAVEEEAVSMPVLRPLLGLDKTEIIEIAREVGTYDISAMPSVCCTLAPSKPSVRAEMEAIIEEENKLDIPCIIEKLLEEIIEVEI